MPSEHLVYTNVCVYTLYVYSHDAQWTFSVHKCVYIYCMFTVMMPSEHLVYTNVCIYIVCSQSWCPVNI
jgi:hypothetical protein